MYKVLKPGGVLGLVAHRGDAEMSGLEWARKGYVPEADAIRIAEAAGFKLVARSEINANPKDTKDYADGVWTLPPGYRRGDVDRDKYEAIGESDRMTLKFVKPEGA
jgi:predicted methyltransferase